MTTPTLGARPSRPLFRVIRRTLVAVLLAAVGALGWLGYHWYAGRAALDRHRAEEAREHFRTVRRFVPDFPGLLLFSARAARQAGREEEAAALLRECERGPKRSPEVVLEGFLLRAAAGALDGEAEDYLRGRAQKEPHNAPLILEALIVGYARMYRPREAMFCLDHWLRMEPNCAHAHYLRGDLRRLVNQVQQAAADFQQALDLDSGHEEARWGLARSLLEVGRADEALLYLEAVARRRPGDPEVRVRLARCRLELGDLDRARADTDALLAAHVDHGPALKLRADVEQLAGRADEAEHWMRRAAGELRHDYSTQYALYQLLQRIGKEDEARRQRDWAQTLKDRAERLSEIRTRTMSERPADAELHCELGVLFLHQGHGEVGELWLRRALALAPDHRLAHAALAAYYEERSERQKASHHRERAGGEAAPTPETFLASARRRGAAPGRP